MTRPHETANRVSTARLSGWVRLWMIYAVLSWIAGGIGIVVSEDPFQWPFPFSEATSQSIRHLLCFLGPFLIAFAWIATRWVWRGFRPPPEQVGPPHITSAEIALVTVGLLIKTSVTLFLLAAMILPLWFESTWRGEELDGIWWDLGLMFHVVFCAYMIDVVWGGVLFSSE